MLKKRIVLASSSPRRVSLLKSLGYKFSTVPHEIEEENFYNSDSPVEFVQKVAFLKANNIAKRVDNALIIGADTIVFQKKRILGKPKDVQDAKRMLSMLSDSEHEVISGVCVMDVPSKEKLLRFDRTRIKMRIISEEEIDIYISSGEPLDKAGSYAIQGEGSKFVEKIEGSYSNAMGLPLEIVQECLTFLGKV